MALQSQKTRGATASLAVRSEKKKKLERFVFLKVQALFFSLVAFSIVTDVFSNVSHWVGGNKCGKKKKYNLSVLWMNHCHANLSKKAHR